MLNHSFRFYCELYVDYSFDKKYKKELFSREYFNKNVTEIINRCYVVLDKNDSPYYFDIKKVYKAKKKIVRKEQFKNIKVKKGVLYALLWKIKTWFF